MLNKLLTSMLLFPTHSVAATSSQEKTAAKHLAKFFQLENVEMLRAEHSHDFARAAYREASPTIGLIVGESEQSWLIYLENCDICANLVAVAKNNSSVTIVKQGHQLDCAQVDAAARTLAITSTICTQEVRQ